MDSMKRREKVGLTLALVAIAAVMGVVYNAPASNNTVKYVPLDITASTTAVNSAIDTVLKTPDIMALVDAKPSRIIATQSIMVMSDDYFSNGTITSHSIDIGLIPGTEGIVEIKNLYNVVVVSILYQDGSGYYVIYDTASGKVGQPIFSSNLLKASK